MSVNEIPENSEKPLDIPKELWMMVDHLFRNSIKQVRTFEGDSSVLYLTIKNHICWPVFM